MDNAPNVVPREEESPPLPNIAVGKEEPSKPESVAPDQEPSAPSPPSPSEEDSWQCDGSPSRLMRVEELLTAGVSPEEILKIICPQLRAPPEGWSDDMVMSILVEILEQPPIRHKLPQYNTFEDAIELFRTSKRILILTGAGVSVSCGIPDFRSKDGIYARLHVDFPDLPDPTAMFDIRYFEHNPAPFYNFAKEIFPGQFEPSISHKFIRQLEKNEQLLRNYTQNIDTLEKQTGIERVIECHGSFSKATCRKCGEKYDGDHVKEDVMAQRVARCTACEDGVIKPDIVFFGEDLAQDFHRQMREDKDHVDLLVVIGSSLKVRPVSLIPFSVSPDVPQILINRETLSNYTADIELLGNCDDVIRDICLALGGQFEELLDSHDSRMTTLKPEAKAPSRKRRAPIPTADFHKIMAESEGDLEEKEEEDGEPESKKICLADMYQRRYVSVESKLPENSYFSVSPNRSIFPGAEVYYDLECKMISRPSRYTNRHGDSSDSSSSDEDDEESEGNTYRAGSEPPDLSRGPPSNESSRCVSCEPAVDVESLISTMEFRRSLEEGVDVDF